MRWLKHWIQVMWNWSQPCRHMHIWFTVLGHRDTRTHAAQPHELVSSIGQDDNYSPASKNFCWASFSPRTANSAFCWRILWRFVLSLNDCTKFRSRSLFSFDTDTKKSGNSGVFICLHRFSRCWYDCPKNYNLPTLAWGYFQVNQVSTRWEPCLLLLYACCCLKLRNVEVNQDSLWWRLLRRSRAGNFCSWWRGRLACACYWGRTWAHNLCLGSDWPESQTCHPTAEWHRCFFWFQSVV